MYVQIVRGNYDRCGRKKKYIKKLNLAELAQLLGLLCIFQLKDDFKVTVSRNFSMQYHIQKVCTKVQLYFFLYWSVYQKVPIMQKSASTGIPLEFTNLKKYQFSGS